MNLKRLIVSSLIASQLALTFPVYADEVDPPIGTLTLPPAPPPVAGEVDVGSAISPMKKGQIAPFTGVLLSPKASATIIVQLNLLSEQIQIEIDRVKGEEKAKCDFRVAETSNTLTTDKKILQAQLDEREKRINIVTDALKKEENSRPNLPLWVGVGTGAGFVLGVGLSILTVYAVGQSSK